MVDGTLMLKKLTQLEEYVTQIEEYRALSVEEYTNDWKLQRIKNSKIPASGQKKMCCSSFSAADKP